MEGASPTNQAVSRVGKREFIGIKFPGIVKDTSAALETLGGATHLSTILREEPKILELKFHPEDPACHPIFADKIRTSQILLKVKTHKRKAHQEKIDFESEVIGVVNTRYQFNGLADFQYKARPPQKRELEEMYTFSERGNYNEPTELRLVPPIFTKVDQPQDYGYGYNEMLEEYQVVDGQRTMVIVPKKKSSQKDEESPIKVAFNIPQVPTGEEEVDLGEIGNQMKNLFKERPIWSKAALLAHMPIRPKKDIKEFKRCISKLAYKFSNGPWRSLYVRFGYDPRQSAESKKWQIIDYRVSSDLTRTYLPKFSAPNALPRRRKKIKVFKVQEHQLPTSGSSEAEIRPPQHDFTSPPVRQFTLYQICDLQYQEIQDIANSPNERAEKCDEKTGWLSKTALKNITSFMDQKLPELIAEWEENNQSAKKEAHEAKPQQTAEEEKGLDMEESENFAE